MHDPIITQMVIVFQLDADVVQHPYLADTRLVEQFGLAGPGLHKQIGATVVHDSRQAFAVARDEQFAFLMAIDEYKRKNTRPFPTWTEVLEVIKALGYRKVAEPQSLEQFKKLKT